MNMRTATQSYLMLVVFTALLVAGCTGRSSRADLDSPSSGTIHISVDESFKPVIDSQIQVYEALNPGTKIIAEYKTEAECFEDFKNDSTRMIIVTRGLNKEEENYYREKLKLRPSWSKVANDGVALIINKDEPDSLFTLNKLKGILTGTTGDPQKVVFDGLQGSSGFRFAQDSILKGEAFDTARVFGEKGSLEVIRYVEKHKNVIGFIGVSWVGNPEDTTQLSFLSKVKIASVLCNCEDDAYVKPYQANIMTRRYPLVRGLYYIIKEDYTGLATGFANFMEYERGQLIFRRAYLGPAKLNFSIRKAS